MDRISDFTQIAARYDASRNIPRSIMTACCDILEAGQIFPSGGKLLDAGCGTGQISIPFASRGLDITGIDVSAAMVDIASAKVEHGWTARYRVGDVRSLIDDDGAFDGTVLSKLLMHIEDWQSVCRELIRVTKPGGCIVEIKDRGFFNNAVRREFSRRADELEFKGRFLGLQPSAGGVSAWMESSGCQVRSLETSHLRWQHQVTPRETLEGFGERLFAEFWYMPRSAYDRVLRETAVWAADQPGGLDEQEHLTPYLDVNVYRTPDGAPR